MHAHACGFGAGPSQCQRAFENECCGGDIGVSALFGDNGDNGDGALRPGALCPPTAFLQSAEGRDELPELTVRALSRNACVGAAASTAGFEAAFRPRGRLVFLTVQHGNIDVSGVKTRLKAGDAVILSAKRALYKVRSEDRAAAAVFAICPKTFAQHVRTRYDDNKIAATADDRVIRQKAEAADQAIRLSLQFAELLDGAPARRLGDITRDAIERALSFYAYEAGLAAPDKQTPKKETPKPDRTTAPSQPHYVVRPHSVRMAEEFIAAHFADIESAAEIAAASKVSTRTLRRGFKTFLGVGPMEYLRDKRLRAARSALKNIDDARPVRDIAESVGYKSYSTFWAQYIEIYQESPSTTRRLMRKSVSDKKSEGT